MLQRRQYAQQIERYARMGVGAIGQIFNTANSLREWYEFIQRFRYRRHEIPVMEMQRMLRRLRTGMPTMGNKNIGYKHKRMNKSKSKSVKKMPTKRKRIPKGKTQVDKRQDAKLKQIVAKQNSTEAIHIRRRRDVQRIKAENKECIHYSCDSINKCDVLELAMNQLRYYDPSDPANLTLSNPSTGTYTRIINVDSVSSKLTLRNNYIVPAKIKVYLCTVRKDTNSDPVSWYANGIADEAFLNTATAGVPDATSGTDPLLYLTDIRQVTEMWNVKLLKSTILQAGHQCSVSHSVGGIRYDPALYDVHSLAFLKSNKAFCFVVRVEGVIGHTETLQMATSAAAVDVFWDTKYVFRYEGGSSVRDISTDDNQSATITGSLFIGNDAVADNQTFSGT